MRSKSFHRSSTGEVWIWLSGAAIALSLVLVGGLFLLILVNGFSSFWPRDLYQMNLADGSVRLGQIVGSDETSSPMHEGGDGAVTLSVRQRIQLRQGNRDLYGEDFIWLDEAVIKSKTRPLQAVVVERREWGNFIGYVESIVDGEQVILAAAPGADAAQGTTLTPAQLEPFLDEGRALVKEQTRIARDEMGEVNRKKEALRLEIARLGGSPEQAKSLEAEAQKLESRYLQLEEQLTAVRARATKKLKLKAVGGQETWLGTVDAIRVYQPNSLSVFGKLGVYLDRLAEFIWEDPRESNTEGGVFPAIFGTVMAVFLMSIIVTPLGVISAIYLREYAKQGRFVSFVRIAVNNLAGVPSIVFGVFGVGFFIYGLGGSIDQLFFADKLPSPTFGTGGILWASLTLALLTVPTVIVSTEEGLASIPKHLREASYALGATKFETTWRVVLPSLTPSILTGVILAVARAAGEVAPLMITGVVKLAPSLPIDAVWPYVHFDRKFMHLGFHIYDVGFQSPNVEAARPMVYMTTALLLLLVVCLNLSALIMRNRLRKRYATSAV